MAKVNYTEDQITTFLAHAQEVGVSRAMRDLSYPGSYNTAIRWADMRGLSLDVDPVKQKAARTANWYREEEKKLVVQEGIARISEQLNEDSLTPVEIDKLMSALKKAIESYALIEGKPTEITQENMQEDGLFNEALKHYLDNTVYQRDLPVEEER